MKNINIFKSNISHCLDKEVREEVTELFYYWSIIGVSSPKLKKFYTFKLSSHTYTYICMHTHKPSLSGTHQIYVINNE